MKRPLLLCFISLLFLQCIGEDFIDDYVEPNLRITNPIVSIREGLSYQFQARFFDESGTQVENPNFSWSATPPSALHISNDGTITALAAGTVSVNVSVQGLQGKNITTALEFSVTLCQQWRETTTPTTDTTSSTTVTTTSTTTTETTGSSTETTTDTSSSTTDTSSSTTDTSTTTTDSSTSETDDGIVVSEQFFEGQIRSTSSYLLQGNFRYEFDRQNIVLSLGENYRADTALPGLYVYLTNNPTTPSGGYEIGKVTVFEGAHQYNLPASIALMDYKYILYWCKPFSVKVGDALLFDD